MLLISLPVRSVCVTLRHLRDATPEVPSAQRWPETLSRGSAEVAQRRPKAKKAFLSDSGTSESFLRSFKAQLRDLGSSVRILKPVDSIDANEAIQLLKRHAIEHGLRRPKLRDLAEQWIDRWQEQHRSVSLGKLFEEYLETRSADSPKHQQSLRYTKEKMLRLHGHKVSTLTKEEIEDAFWKLPPSSFNAHIRRVRSVLAFGVKHGYLSRNPALLIQQIKRPRQSVKILPVETVELMLRTAQASVSEVLPSFVSRSLPARGRKKFPSCFGTTSILKTKSCGSARRSQKPIVTGSSISPTI